jgi:hypothetical protein
MVTKEKEQDKKEACGYRAKSSKGEIASFLSHFKNNFSVPKKKDKRAC